MSEKMSGYMGCETFQKNLNAFLDGELDEILRAKMIGHAQTCPSCAEELERMTRLLTMCAEMDQDIVMPLAGQVAWRSTIRDKSKAKNRPHISAWLQTVGTMAAALVLLVAGTIAYRSQGPLSLNDYGAMSNSRALNPQSAKVEKYSEYDVAYDAHYPSATPLPIGGVQKGIMLSTETDGATDDMSGQIDGSGDVLSPGSGETEGRREAVILRSAVREMETTSFDADLSNLQDLIKEYDGYYENSALMGEPLAPGESTGRIMSMVTRIPSKDLSEFLESLKAIGKTTYAAENADDISGQYYDVQIRLDTYRAQLKRLNELIELANTMEDMIVLEDKLYEVQNSIDSLEGRLRNWSSHATDSTVTITIREVAPRDAVQPIGDTLSDRMRTGFYDSVNWLIGFLQDMSVFLAIIAPQLVIVIPLLVLVIVIVRIVRRRKR